MRRNMLKTFADSRRMKYSTISIAFCAVVIALAIILNSIVSALATHFNWYIDMTDKQMFSLSEEAKAMLDDINDEVQLEIIFPMDRDRIDSSYAVSSSSGSIGHIHKTALEIAEECDNVKVSYHDVKKDYEFYNSINLESFAGEGKILILRKNAENKYVEGDFRSYGINNFYVQKSATDTSLYAYNGELIFLTSLVAMSRDTIPTVYFTVGHNEQSFQVADVEVSYNTITQAIVAGKIHANAANLMGIFTDSGFTVKPLDLRTQEIPADAKMMVINQPTNDFNEDELYKLEVYLQNGGATFCFTPNNASLPNLYAKLQSDYGITVNSSDSKVIDNDHRMTNGGITHYLANVSMHDDGFASSKYFSAYSSYSSANAYYNGSASIDIDERFMNTEGFATGGTKKYTYPLLESASTASFGDKTGVFNLMSITSIDKFVNQKSVYSYLVVCPSSDFASSAALSLSSANRHMILSLIQNTSSVQTPVNLDYKPFVNYKLTITDSQAQTTTIVLATILPVIVALCGIAVIVRRKHR